MTTIHSSTSDFKSVGVYPALASTISIYPVMSLFFTKAHQQVCEPVKNLWTAKNIVAYTKAAPTIGGIVGVQKYLLHKFEEKFGHKHAPLPTKFADAVMVGLLCSPALILFQGQTMGLSLKESMMRINFKLMAASTMRESTFLASDAINKFIKQKTEAMIGKSILVEYSSAFLGGAIGGVCGHPFDCMLTRWQKGLKVNSVIDLTRGAYPRTLALAVFGVLYTFTTNMLLGKKMMSVQPVLTQPYGPTLGN